MNLAYINDRWNFHISPLPEAEGKDDWQTPLETIARGTGDCEDIAIGKYFSLICADLGHLKASVATVKMKSGLAHCMLFVDGWALDNLSKEIVKVSARTDMLKVIYLSNIEHPNDPRFLAMYRRVEPDSTIIGVSKFLKGK